MPLFVGASESYDTDAWEAYNLKNENTNLRERITTQKQTIQAYRDESREWREVAERAQAENAKLRELVRDLYLCSDETCTDCEHHDYSGEGFWCKRGVGWKKARMRELGVEVE